MDQDITRHEPETSRGSEAVGPRARADRINRAVKRFSRNGLTDRFGIAAESFSGYVIRRVIRRGGQGVVYEAIHEATNRPVAIKVSYESLRRDPTSRVRIAREVEVLSQLRHPHIVRLTDGGEVKGRFYFVTDYIQGASLDKHLKTASYSTRETTSLFITICEAVYAAHRRGIVHRDLKPSNVIIDHQHEPHILDFGLAKLTKCDEHTSPRWEQMTVTGQFLGSLPWAAPEQVEGDSRLIDCRTDVYALGVMLYHAFTQRFPYDISSSTRAAMDNILRATPDSFATATSSFEDDLQTVVLKCLSKEPDRRYRHAGELAAELRRCLAGEPIAAKRDSRSYVLAKIISQYRVAALSIAAAVVVTVAYAITITVLYHRETTARQIALTATAQSRRHAEAQRDTIGFLVNEVSSKLADIPGAITARRMTLEGAYQRLAALEADLNDDPKIRATTLGMLGDILQALGDYEGALTRVREALELYETLSQAEPDNPDRRADLSIAFVRVGDVQGDLGDYGPRRANYNRALAIDERLVEQHSESRHFRDNLLWSYERLGADSLRAGDLETAQTFLRKQRAVAAQLAAEEPDNSKRAFALYRAMRNLVVVAERMGKPDSVQRLITEMLTLAETRAASYPDDPEARFQLALSYRWAGNYAAGARQNESATKLYQRAIRSFREDTTETSGERVLSQLSNTYDSLGQLRRTAGDLIGAEMLFREALDAAERLFRLAPHAAPSQRCVFLVLRDLTTTLDQAGRADAAQVYADRAVLTGEHILEDGRTKPNDAADIAYFLAFRTPSRFRDVALMIKTLEGVTSIDPTKPTFSHVLLGLLYHARGDTRQAIDTLRSALSALSDKDIKLKQYILRALSQVSEDAALFSAGSGRLRRL